MSLADPQRLAALRATALLDSPAEPEFDRLTSLAARILRVPVALTSLVDDRRQFFKSCFGLPDPVASERGTPLSHSFCQHVVRTGEPLVISDAREVADLRDNLAIRDLGLIAYLGVPLMAPGGEVLGSFCAIDHEPREWTADDIATVRDLAHAVMTEIALREELRLQRETEAALEEARDAAQSASRAKSDFVANMSHEIRTPLNGVIGMLQLLDGTALSDDQHRYVRTALSSGDALLGVVNDVLDFSKVEAGRLALDEHDFDLRLLVEETCEMLAPAAQAKSVELLHEIDDGLPSSVRSDAARWRQVLSNLLSNAIKFTREGEVVVRVAYDGAGVVRLEVSDTGIGIAPERLAALFEPFTQADASTTRHFGGTGLGLAISRRLVELLGGDLTVESVPGEGSTFGFGAPVGAGDASRPTRPGRRAIPATAVILVADPNARSRAALCAQLSELARRTEVPVLALTTAAGGEALETLRAGEHAAVLMDVQMPGVDGFEATTRIRALEDDAAGVPIIAMTAGAMEGDRERCLRAGMDDYLAKPVREPDLDAILERWLSPGA